MGCGVTIWGILTAMGTVGATGVALLFGTQALRSERARARSERWSLRTGLYAIGITLDGLTELAEIQMTDAGRPRAQPKITQILLEESGTMRALLPTLGPLTIGERDAVLRLWGSIDATRAALPKSPADVKEYTLRVTDFARKMCAVLETNEPSLLNLQTEPPE